MAYKACSLSAFRPTSAFWHFVYFILLRAAYFQSAGPVVENKRTTAAEKCCIKLIHCVISLYLSSIKHSQIEAKQPQYSAVLFYWVKLYYINWYFTWLLFILTMRCFYFYQGIFPKTSRCFSRNMRILFSFAPVFLHNYSFFFPDEAFCNKLMLVKRENFRHYVMKSKVGKDYWKILHK